MTTYYVENGGNDGAAGTTPGAAWATISKVNGESYSAGDEILFNRGDVWREQLTIPSAGSADNPLTFGAYGSGDLPKITGTDLLTTWTLYTGNIYSATYNNGIDTYLLLEDDIPLQRIAGTGTTLLDDFNRANTPSGGTPSGWTKSVTGNGIGMEINSNALKLGSPYSGIGSVYWNIVYGQDSGVAATIGTPVGGFNEMGMFLGIADPGSTFDGYELRVYRAGGDDEAYLYRRDNGTRTQLGATVSLGTEVAAGDAFRMRRDGNDIVVEWNDGGGGWSSLMTRTDATYTAAGYIGLYVENNTGTWDDFGTYAEVPPLTAAGQFYADDANDTIYAWCTDNADPDTHTMEIGARYYAGLASGKDWITLSNIHWHGAGGQFGAGFQFNTQSSNLAITGCEFSASYYAGLWLLYDSGNSGPDDVAINGTTIHHQVTVGLYAEGESAVNPLSGLSIDGCTIHSNGDFSESTHGAHVRRVDDVTIVNSSIYSNTGSLDWGGGLYLDTATNATIRSNRIYDNDKMGIGLDVNSNGFSVTDNFIYNNAQNGVMIEDHLVADGTSELRRNVTYQNVRGIYLGPGGVEHEVSGVTIECNICAFDTLSAWGIDGGNGGDIADYLSNTVDFNCYWSSDGDPVFHTEDPDNDYDLAGWKTLTNWDANSIVANPQFINPPSRFTLRASSPVAALGCWIDIAAGGTIRGPRYGLTRVASR